MNRVILLLARLTPLIFLIAFFSCNHQTHLPEKIRPLKDIIGFAQYPWQIDSLMARINRDGWEQSKGQSWKLAICPHDDYTYVGKLYPELLQHISTPLVILIGVAHPAARMGIADSLVFDSYSHWKGPWKNILIPSAREELFEQLKDNYAIKNDSLQKMEHSLEALVPFLQYFNRDVSIIPILVPAMSPSRMEDCGKALAMAIRKVADKHKWKWGIDYSIVATTDAVHYGNQDWGGSDYAFFGCDSAGNMKARLHEKEIIDNCIIGDIKPDKIKLFNSYTIDQNDFRKYKWTWCGRYSVPVALYTAFFLNGSIPLSGELSGYSTSITSTHVNVDDLQMGRTAIATDCHWVGYPSIGYK